MNLRVCLFGLLAAAAPLGCADVDEAGTPAPKPPRVDFTDCEDNPAFDCGTLEVPVDHAAPNGPTMKIPVVRVRALAPEERIGSLLLNPGGPGGSGVDLAKLASFVIAPELRDKFDLIGFDPRGEAGSTPPIDCTDDLDPFIALDTTPDDAAEEKALVEVSQSLVDGCEARSAALLPFVGTDSIVRDMDLLREALGDDKLTYLGFSYGTFLGAIYAETFPDHVRALVLDGALDPSLSNEQFIEGQSLAFEQELEEMFTWCAADEACPLGKEGDPAEGPAAAYDALLAAVEEAPLPAPGSGDRTVGPGEFSYGVSAALYQPGRWPKLAEALATAAKGDGSALLDLADGYAGRSADGTYDNNLEVYYAVTSIDTASSRDPATIAALAAKMRDKAPRIGAYLPYSALPSALWPVPPWRGAVPVTAAGAPPILVVGGTRDPATPYLWSEALAKQLPGAALLTRDGDGHTSFLRGNACIDEAVTAYLVSGTLPTPGTICDD